MNRFLCILFIVIIIPSVAIGDFVLIAIPDTQTYSQFYPEVFTDQTEWIKDNYLDKNIIFVLHEGDVVNHMTSFTQWDNANDSMSVLDTFVPYTISVGNHDMGTDPIATANNRNTTMFNKYFPYQRYNCNDWYGDHMGQDNDNHYVLFTADGMDFMIVTLEFGPSDAMLGWANNIVSANPNRRVIVLTHCYSNHGSDRVGDEDMFNPHGYGIHNTGTNDGDEMWHEFVKHHQNIFLVISGHVHSSDMSATTGMMTSIGINGNTVHQILANYQSFDSDGGWLRIYKFVPNDDKILVTTYSPTLDEYLTDEHNQFELLYDMFNPPTGCCCLDDNTSIITKESECLEMNNGLYLGDDISCDECPTCVQTQLAQPSVDQTWYPMNKYLSIDTGNSGRNFGVLVTILNSEFFPETNGWRQWVKTTPIDTFRLTDFPQCMDWSTFDILITEDIIVPESLYKIQLIDCDCPSFSSQPNVISTSFVWGDVAGMFGSEWTPPDGVVDFNDINAVVLRFQGHPDAPPLQACDLYPDIPDGIIDFNDIETVISAFRNLSYPFGFQKCRGFYHFDE